MKTEAQFLLAKLHYATGDYNDALKFLEKAHPEEISVKETSPTRLKMLAESYAIKGKIYVQVQSLKVLLIWIFEMLFI